jgi:hypothetical protein
LLLAPSYLCIYIRAFIYTCINICASFYGDRLPGIASSIRDEFRLHTHVMTIAVGAGAKQEDLRAISCRLNGLFFIVSRDQVRPEPKPEPLHPIT